MHVHSIVCQYIRTQVNSHHKYVGLLFTELVMVLVVYMLPTSYKLLSLLSIIVNGLLLK